MALAILFYVKPRRSALLITTDEQPLGIPSKTGLTVSFGTEEIPNPRILTAQFRNLGPNDVTPADLVGGHMYLLTKAGSVLSVSATQAQVAITRAPNASRSVSEALDAELAAAVGDATGTERTALEVDFVKSVIHRTVPPGSLSPVPDRIDITSDIIEAGDVITVTAVAKERTEVRQFAKLAGFTTKTTHPRHPKQETE